MTLVEVIYNYWTSLLIIIAILLIILLLIKENRGLPPGPWSLPIVGYLMFIDGKRPYISLTELCKKYGPICHIKLGCVRTVILSDPAIIKEALSRNVFTARANLYLTHGIMGGYGLIAAEGERWKDQRKFVSNALRYLGMVKSKEKRNIMEERILVGVRKAIFDISKTVDKAVNSQEILLDSLGNVVNSLILGTTWNSDDPEWLDLKNLIEVGVKLIGVAGPVNFLPFLRWIPKYKRRIEYIFNGMERTHSLYRKLFEERSNEEDNIMSLFKKEMQTGNNEHFHMKQMYHIVADLCGAGTDTTMATLRWFLLYMAIYTNVQDKVQDELDRVLKERNEPSLDDLQNLPYTEACIKEAQRIRSVVPLGIPHGTYEDTELYGYKIPKDTMILPLQWAVHMNAEVWINPDHFIPERFLDENNKASNKHSHFIPFQNGKRMCVGDELGRMLLFLFSSGILKIYNVRLGEDYESKTLETILEGICGITLEPGHHRLKFIQRKQQNY